jgi:NitT/TauT family transport system ATP-binding protein
VSIQIHDISKSFVTSTGSMQLVLKHLDLQVTTGEVHGIIGPSGCGKTTLLRLIAGLETLDAGTITIDNLNPSEARSRGLLGMAFQVPGLMPWRTVKDNIALPFDLRRSPRQSGYIDALLDLAELKQASSLLPSQLSGGMAHRAALCRAMALKPSTVLLDEPFANLDWGLRRRLLVDLKMLLVKTGSTALLVTHDVREVAFLADRVSILRPKPASVVRTFEISDYSSKGPDIFTTAEFHQFCDTLQAEADAA